MVQRVRIGLPVVGGSLLSVLRAGISREVGTLQDAAFCKKGDLGWRALVQACVSKDEGMGGYNDCVC